MVNNPLANARHIGDMGSVPGLGRSSGVGNGNPLQYYCLENPMDRGGLGYREDSRESFGLPGDQASQS